MHLLSVESIHFVKFMKQLVRKNWFRRASTLADQVDTVSRALLLLVSLKNFEHRHHDVLRPLAFIHRLIF